VDWGASYSLQAERLSGWFEREGGAGWMDLRRDTLELLQRGRELRDIAGLVGPDALQDADRLALESARNIQELVLAQSAYDANDAASPIRKTFSLASLALRLHRQGLKALAAGARFDQLEIGVARRAVAAFRTATPEEAGERLRLAEEALDLVRSGASP
jgi:V/A-type H+-transporting ATPase subunit A